MNHVFDAISKKDVLLLICNFFRQWIQTHLQIPLIIRIKPFAYMISFPPLFLLYSDWQNYLFLGRYYFLFHLQINIISLKFPLLCWYMYFIHYSYDPIFNPKCTQYTLAGPTYPNRGSCRHQENVFPGEKLCRGISPFDFRSILSYIGMPFLVFYYNFWFAIYLVFILNSIIFLNFRYLHSWVAVGQANIYSLKNLNSFIYFIFIYF